MRLKAASLLIALSAFAAPRALAQGIPGLDLERLQLDPSAAGSLVIGNGEVGVAGTSRTSLSFGYQHNPFMLQADGTFRGRGAGFSDTKTGAVVQDRYTATLGLSLTVIDRLEVYVRAPYVAWQRGDNLTAFGITKPVNSGAGTPSIGLRLGVAGQEEGAPVTIAVAADVLPSWGTEAALAGNSSFAFAPRVEVGHRFSRFLVAAQGFALIREAGIPLRAGDIAGNEYGGGVAVASTGKIRGEISYRIAVNEYKLSTSSEALAGVRYGTGKFEIFALAGPGFGGAPGTPDFRGLVGIALNGAAK